MNDLKETICFKDYVPKALLETLKHQHNTCIGRHTYMKLATDIGKKFLHIRKLEVYSPNAQDIVSQYIKLDEDKLKDVIAVPKVHPYSYINKILEEIIEKECGFPVDVYFMQKCSPDENIEDTRTNIDWPDDSLKDKGNWIVWKKGESPFLPKGGIKYVHID